MGTQGTAGTQAAAAAISPDAAGDAQRSRPSRLGGERERAILQATYDLLAEVGYECVRMDEVAARARASKATLYRHWPRKAQLVVDAIRMCKGSGAAAPDTGSLRGDLIAWFSEMADAVTGEEGPLLAGVVMAMHNDPELAAEMRALHSSKSPIAQVMCDRAEARGELRPGYNVDLIEEIVPGLMFMHSFVLGEPVDARFVGHLVDDIILPLLSR
ncbi:TetR/AcrR family transcriptional regulator [Rugosimonospora africana]|uniref:TetR family transcriptional regulator n=1 Tax=Rugosimonospora africana TaxID=556532 RepID=A0A8J3QPM1_9ACTN|nr:TetR/AcrR family transcriptional regulator [Rugosimonospora africana]GIH14206.1 TetR family transcriptional regulator [Rugosimonospora africana]